MMPFPDIAAKEDEKGLEKDLLEIVSIPKDSRLSDADIAEVFSDTQILEA